MNGLNQFLPQRVIPGEGQGLWVAVAVSLLLHVLIVSLLFKLSLHPVSLQPVTGVTPTTLSVRLVSGNTLRLPSESARSVPPSVESESLTIEVSNLAEVNRTTDVTESLASGSDQSPEAVVSGTRVVKPVPATTEFAEQAEAESGRSTAQRMETSASSGSGEASEKAGEFAPPRSNPELELPQVVLPSRSDLARSLRIIKRQDENTSRLWSYGCTPVQQASELVVCEDSKGANSASGGRFESRYAITTQTYQRFNPASAPSRAQLSLPIISSGAAGLAARLAAADIPDDLRGYLNAELEAGITHNVNQGSIAAEMLDRLTDQSDAAQIVRETLSDPWIRSRIQPRLSARMPVGN